MTWLALADHTHRRYSSFGIGLDRQPQPVIADTDCVQMQTGTVLIEASMPDSDRPQLLFGYEKNDHPGHRFMAIRALPGGGLSCLVGFGGDVQHVALDYPTDNPKNPLWISVSWDAARQTVRLALEVPGTPNFATREVPLSVPFFGSDLEFAITQLAHLPKSASFVALSDQWEPLGPTPTMMPDTPIMTPFGFKPVGTLSRGDLVMTSDGQQVPVLCTIRRRLPARGLARPIRIRAPYFGLRQDCIVSATQCLQACGSHVEYAHGCESVLIPAGHLLNGYTATEEPVGPIIDYVQVLTPIHTALSVAGSALESLFAGRIRRHKDKCAASQLNILKRRDMPEHLSTVAPVLDHSATLFLEQQRFG